MIVTIHQPNYLPWLGFFHKIYCSDVFVVFDDVQLPRGKKNNFMIRNRIKTEGGAKWLTIPISNKSELLPINKAQINNKIDWNLQHWNSIKSNYAKTNFFSEFSEILKNIFYKKWELLSDLNVTIIKLLMDILRIKTKLVRSSELKIKSSGTEKILDIVTKLGGNHYLSGTGPGSIKYTLGQEKLFEDNGVKIVYHKFTPPCYKQLFGDFIPNLSVCDMLFNIGKEKTIEGLKSN